MTASLFAGSSGYSFFMMNTPLLVPPRTMAQRNISISGCMTGPPTHWNPDLSDQVHGFGGSLQLIAEFGMGERDQRMRALGRGQTLDVHRSELSDDVVGVDARRGDRPVEPRHDAGDLALGRGRSRGDDRLSTLGRIGAAHEVELAARSTVL